MQNSFNSYLHDRLEALSNQYMSVNERVKLAPYVKANNVKSESNRISDLISKKYGRSLTVP